MCGEHDFDQGEWDHISEAMQRLAAESIAAELAAVPAEYFSEPEPVDHFAALNTALLDLRRELFRSSLSAQIAVEARPKHRPGATRATKAAKAAKRHARNKAARKARRRS